MRLTPEDVELIIVAFVQWLFFPLTLSNLIHCCCIDYDNKETLMCSILIQIPNEEMYIEIKLATNRI